MLLIIIILTSVGFYIIMIFLIILSVILKLFAINCQKKENRLFQLILLKFRKPIIYAAFQSIGKVLKHLIIQKLN